MSKKDQNKDSRFDLYRYQILPRDRYFQGDFFEDISSIEELIEQKNNIFNLIVKDLVSLKDSYKHTLIFNQKYISEDFLLFQVAVNRSITIETQDFTQKEMENWPSFLLGIWNDPNEQILIIQERRDAYQNTSTVVTTLQKEISELLKPKQLNIFIEPLFKKEEFWKIADHHKGKIRDIKFELITPNMANISGGLSEDLKSFARVTNTSKTTMTIASESESSLNINKDDKNLLGMVEYASKGGGDISFKISGIEQRIHTTSTKKNVKISEMEIQTNNPETIIELLKVLVGNEDC